MKRKRPAQSEIDNLKPRYALDRPGKTQKTSVGIKPEDARFFESTPHGRPYHIRQAIALYRQLLDQGMIALPDSDQQSDEPVNVDSSLLQQAIILWQSRGCQN